MSLKLEWSANTGYVQNYPPKAFEIHAEDLEGMTDDEIVDRLYEWALEDFQQNYGVSVANTDIVIAAVRAHEAGKA